MNRHHSYTQQKYALIAMLLVILYCLLFGCKIKPDGKDENGWYVYTDSCISDHVEMVTNYTVDANGNMTPYFTSSIVCDEYETAKYYPNIKRIDSSKYEKTPTK